MSMRVFADMWAITATGSFMSCLHSFRDFAQEQNPIYQLNQQSGSDEKTTLQAS